MSNAIRWTPEMLADYEKRLGRPLKIAKQKDTAAPEPKASKYNAQKVVTDDGVFDSKKEHRRWLVLKDEVARGLICDLVAHPTFKLAPKVKQADSERATPALRYEADFMYVRDGRLVIEDVKGMKTRVYMTKKHIMLATLGLTITEV